MIARQTKSANPLYTKGSNRLLVCDTLLGKACAIEGWSKDFPLKMHMKTSTTGANSGKHYLDADLKSVREKGFDSVFAPRDCSDAGGVKFDEMIQIHVNIFHQLVSSKFRMDDLTHK